MSNNLTLGPEIIKISKQTLAVLRRDNKLPTRLDDEDYYDLIQEGCVAGLSCIATYDPARGSLRAFLSKPVARAQLALAWKTAHVGITGDCSAVQVWSMDSGTGTGLEGLARALEADDVADEIEAFDQIFHSFYIKS